MGRTLSALAALASSLNAAELLLKHSDGTECAIETRTDPDLGVVVHSSCPVVSSDGQFKSNFLKIQACNTCGVVGRHQVLDFICPSYFGAEVTITMSQTNGGSTNNHYIRGIWYPCALCVAICHSNLSLCRCFGCAGTTTTRATAGTSWTM